MPIDKLSPLQEARRRRRSLSLMRTGSEIVARAGAHCAALTVLELRLGNSLPARAVSAVAAFKAELAAARDTAVATLDAHAVENRARDAESAADAARADTATTLAAAETRARCGSGGGRWQRRSALWIGRRRSSRSATCGTRATARWAEAPRRALGRAVRAHWAWGYSQYLGILQVGIPPLILVS
jgi:hypothetical protein